MENFKISMAAARKNAGLTQSEAAEKLGIAVKTLQNWELGKHAMKRYEVIAAAAVYGCPASIIFFEK